MTTILYTYPPVPGRPNTHGMFLQNHTKYFVGLETTGQARQLVEGNEEVHGSSSEANLDFAKADVQKVSEIELQYGNGSPNTIAEEKDRILEDYPQSHKM